jgi:hypothetical protein
MELCELCQGISRRKWEVEPMESWGKWIEHHESYRNLCKSVSEGCRLCTLLRAGLLEEGEEARYLERDAEGESKFWMVQEQTYPGNGEGFLCDTTLLTGFYYASLSPDEVDEIKLEPWIFSGLGPSFQLRAPSSMYTT